MKPTISMAILLSAALGLSGCNTAAYQARQQQQQAAAQAQQISTFQSKCAAYGFKDGTPEMANCVQKEAIAQQQDNNPVYNEVRRQQNCNYWYSLHMYGMPGC